jgi:type 1 fimbria pilin
MMKRGVAVLIALGVMSLGLALLLALGRRSVESPIASAIKMASGGQGIKGSGVFVEKEFAGEPLREIEVSGPFVLTVLPDDSPLKVRVDDNLLELLDVDRRGSRLKVSWRGGVSPTKEVTLAVGAAGLANLEISGAAQATVQKAAGSKFVVKASGASEIKLDGSVQACEVELQGSSQLTGTLGQVQSMQIEAEGASTAALSAFGSLAKLEASGASNVEVNGEFESVELEASGASTVEALASRSMRGSASGASTVVTRMFDGLKVETSGASSIRPKS